MYLNIVIIADKILNIFILNSIRKGATSNWKWYGNDWFGRKKKNWSLICSCYLYLKMPLKLSIPFFPHCAYYKYIIIIHAELLIV